MAIKQISVFVENKPGRLSFITRQFKDNAIDIRALSIADTKDFGILRVIVNNPVKAKEVLEAAGCRVLQTNVIAIGIDDKPGSLCDALNILYENNISVEYMYAFISKTEDTAYVILRVDNTDIASEVLASNDVKLLTSEDIYEM